MAVDIRAERFVEGKDGQGRRDGSLKSLWCLSENQTQKVVWKLVADR